MNIILADSPTVQSALKKVCKEDYTVLLVNDVIGLPTSVQWTSVTYFKTLRTSLEGFEEFVKMHIPHINPMTQMSVVIAYDTGQ